MSSPVIALTAAEAEAIARARAALSWIRADTFPWPVHGARPIHETADCLRGALDDYAGLAGGSAHPAVVFPELDGRADNAMEIALDRVTQDIRDWTRALVALANEAEEAARLREEAAA